MLWSIGCQDPTSSHQKDLSSATTPPPPPPQQGEGYRNIPSPAAVSAELNSRQKPRYSSRIRLKPLSDELFPRVIPQNGSQHGFATILESLGSGGACVDVDQDDLPDVLVAGGGDLRDKVLTGRPVYFLRNTGRRFIERTDVAGLSETAYYHHGIAAADFDNDGFQDLLVTGYGGLQFFHNFGDGTFEEISVASKLEFPSWSASSGWGDFNRDGNLDLYVAAYVNWSFANDPPCFAADGIRRDNCSPKLFDALPDQLFISNGDGTFHNATTEFGVRPDGKALGVVIADIDLDGYVDAYVGNDVMTNFLYRNELGRKFSDHSISGGAGVSNRGSPDASMGVEAADYNLDGRPDLWAANFEMESFALYQNQGQMLFRHVSESAGVSAVGEQYVGWGSIFGDLDLDGDEEICVCNGNVVRFPVHSPAMQRMLLLENVNGSYFEDVTSQAGESLLVPRNGRGLAVVDWNRDGLPDLMATPIESPAILFENQTPAMGHSLTVTLVGTISARQAIGTVIEVQTTTGKQFRQLKGGGSYASTSLPEIQFGIPAGVSVQEVRIRWPSGIVAEVKDPAVNNRLTIIEDRPGDAYQLQR